MAVTVETGTGSATANAFCDRDYVIAYAAARGLSFDGDSAALDQAVVTGGDYLANEVRFPWLGVRQTATQRLPYPRTGVIERGGLAVPESSVPWRLKDANAELAILVHAGVDLQADLRNGGLLLKRNKVDVLEKEWFAPTSFQVLTPLPGETMRVTVLGFLAPLLRAPGRTRSRMEYSAPADASPFVPGEFDA